MSYKVLWNNVYEIIYASCLILVVYLLNFLPQLLEAGCILYHFATWAMATATPNTYIYPGSEDPA